MKSHKASGRGISEPRIQIHRAPLIRQASSSPNIKRHLHLTASCSPSTTTMSSMLQSFRNLSPRTRIGVGIAFLAWGTIGLYISDNAEKRLGFEATEKDREALGVVVPRITVVEREGKGDS
ncbi:uncharacterized protein LY89DRAFT_723501 [Mollisia scopiformis]|uniref:Uncharacterized protein n=1 Tax=Mollisia scopiformis TaxID=149040 RepID=A0A132BCT3_MOLSC|nr:uncharacterized protein LY89DRAFT_723501 [Mollisia scopiformis]KUJ10240.1 hypothetical protein LY89DRAFT_723501 [Mollisia scopiformis]